MKACASQCGGYSNEGETLVLYAPIEAPVLTLPAQSTGSYVLSWTSVARAASYVVEQEINASNNWVAVAPDSGQGAASQLRSFTGQAVANYRYRVKAANAAGRGPAFTGHCRDADTGLVYMQQRYHDPLVGRFLGIDAVAVDTDTATDFCRYCYAADNPYKFTDPDGFS